MKAENMYNSYSGMKNRIFKETSFHELWQKVEKSWHFFFDKKNDKFLWILTKKLEKMTLLFFDKKRQVFMNFEPKVETKNKKSEF